MTFDCDRLDPARHRHCLAFKAATLHGLEVRPGGAGLHATVLMDT
jgi:SHS2 domain-containing protein